MDFTLIFTEMSWIPAVLLCVGAIFIVIEVFMPGFGFFGISGSVLIVAGIIVRIIEGLSLLQSIMLILIVLLFFIVCFIFMVIGAKSGLISSSLFENSSTLSEDYNKVSKELRKLVGRSGKAISQLNLGGKAKINGKIYDVQSINSYIEPGSHIKVVEIKDNTIMVRKWFE